MTQTELIEAVTSALTGAGFTLTGSNPQPLATEKPVTVGYQWGQPAGNARHATVYTDRVTLTVEAPTVASQTDAAVDALLIQQRGLIETAMMASATLKAAAIRLEGFTPPTRGRARRATAVIYSVRRFA